VDDKCLERVNDGFGLPHPHAAQSMRCHGHGRSAPRRMVLVIAARQIASLCWRSFHA
jgi:hypothetical protein